MYRLLVGEVAGQRGELDTSITYIMSTFEQIADPQIADHATQIAIYAQDYAAAYTAAKRWVELAPEDAEANRTMAFLSLQQGHTDETAVYLRRVLGEYADDNQQGFLVIASLLGREIQGQSKAEPALQLMRDLVAETPGNPYAHFAYGNLASVFGRWQTAKDELNTSLSLQPDHVPSLILHARVLRELGETEAGIKELSQAVQRHPEDNHLRLAYARMLLSANRYPEARVQYEVLLGDMPNDPDLLYTLALLNLDMDETDKADTYFQRLRQTGSRTAEANYYLGRIAEIRRQYEAAIQSYSRIDRGEYRLDAQIRIGHLLGNLDRLDDARKHFGSLREQNTNAATRTRLYLEEAMLLDGGGHNEQAIELLSEGLAEFPGNTDLLYTRGLSYDKVGRLDLLERDMLSILAREPGNADALNTLGYTLANRTERYQEAYDFIQQAIALKPDNAAIIDSMGWVLYRMGRHEESLKYLKRALALQFDTEIAAHLSEVLWVAGDRPGAESVLRNALEKEPKDPKLLNVMNQLHNGQVSKTP
ncbi:MAG TPA: tetratricopeptide repeat protein, partial [Gammaproteobacteria bacterium]|nr:tetratricopeptide repeat protein [Gammaproteobacteria bacterium]